MTTPVPFQPMRPWRSHPRETVALGALALAATLAVAGGSGATPVLPELLREAGPTARAALPAPPAPLSMEVRPLAPETALEVNARIPVAGGPGAPARPFQIAKAAGGARERALECLTSAIYYEAGQESADGQRAVAQVVLNRVRHPAFPASVCGVVFEGSTRVTGCQFTFTCDGSMSRRPVPSLWDRARKVASEMLGGRVYAPVGYATHYHANYVVPYWASSLAKASVEGTHIFYRWAGGWGRPAAFVKNWSGREGDPAALRTAALSAPHRVVPATMSPGAVAELEARGAVVTEQKGRVRVFFTPEAREAVEKVKVVPYIERTSATDNLRYALDGGGAPADQQAFGKAAETKDSSTAAQ